VFRYRLHSPDGDDLREATYAQMIYPGEEIPRCECRGGAVELPRDDHRRLSP
jgi:hypothetical protein